jgi:hypothetical protein
MGRIRIVVHLEAIMLRLWHYRRDRFLMFPKTEAGTNTTCQRKRKMLFIMYCIVLTTVTD